MAFKAKVLIEVEFEAGLEDVSAARIAGFLDQLVQEDGESRDYEEQHGYLDPDDRAFMITAVRHAS